MPMYWTFNCFLGCIYTVYYIVHIVFLVLNWLSNLEFWRPKKDDQVAQIGVRGLGNSGNARKKMFFFSLMSSLTHSLTHDLVDLAFFTSSWIASLNSSSKLLKGLLVFLVSFFFLIFVLPLSTTFDDYLNNYFRKIHVLISNSTTSFLLWCWIRCSLTSTLQ